MQDFEKLGSFYLGRLLDAERKSTDNLLLYDAKDLVTHAVCVGMTGSGKTGLCIDLLEEAAIDNIPAIVIDPKGDIGNLLLTFPQLRPEDFRPWIDEQEAERGGVDPDTHARNTAGMWKAGLASWGQSPDRIARLREAVDMAIYTPGSSAGLPVSLLRSFAAPSEQERGDLDAMRDRILGTVSGLLALIGVAADPVQSREHILISNILDHAWRQGKDMGVADVIRSVLTPPFDSLGVFDIESFFPEKERRVLAMQLNNVLASPSFAAWMEGDPLDVQSLLYTAEGKPRISILCIAHLSDAERMFFVTLLLNDLISWMRRQTGTTSLRAILYMDEIFGYFPPTAEPPSKKPMLTLLKQARAFGVGCVLATQNPVDLDYKGLGNTGTWFIGRLQTERDKLRVLDGLEGAVTSSGRSFDRSEMDALLSGLGKRVFLMNNVHDDAPVLFESRWALSYLRGPLTRTQIETLMADRKRRSGDSSAPLSSTGAAASVGTPKSGPTHASVSAKPKLAPAAPEVYLAATAPMPSGREVLYIPRLLTTARLHFVHAKSVLDSWEEHVILAPIPVSAVDAWDGTTILGSKPDTSDSASGDDPRFAEMPPTAAKPANMTAWRKSLADWLYRTRGVTLWQCPALKLLSTPGETESDFRIRLTQTYREFRDAAMEELRARYVPRYSRAEERVRKAEQRVSQQEAQYQQQKVSTAVDIGSTLLGALFGRRAGVGTLARRAATSAGRAGRAMTERSDVARAQEDLSAARSELAALEEQFKDEAAQLQLRFGDVPAFDSLSIAPRKIDIDLAPFVIAWVPFAVTPDGKADPLLTLQ